MGDVADDGDDSGKCSQRRGEAWETSPTTGTTVGSAPGVLTWLVPIIAGARAWAGREDIVLKYSLAMERNIEQYENIKKVMQISEGLAKLGPC